MANIGRIEIDTSVAAKSLNDLQKELKEAKKALNDLSIGSKEFEEQAQAVRDIEEELKGVNQQLKGQQSAYETFQRGVIGSLQSIAGGAQTIVAAMQLFGSENEDVLKSLQRMQALMGFTSGLQSFKQLSSQLNNIRKAITATNTALGKTKAAIAGTGIGILLILLASLYTNWDKVSTSIDNFCNKTLGKSWQNIKDFFTNFDNYLAKLKGSVVGFFQNIGGLAVSFGTTIATTINPKNWFTEEGREAMKQQLNNLHESFSNFTEGIHDAQEKALDEQTTQKQLKLVKAGISELEESYKRDEVSYSNYLNRKLELLNKQAKLEKKANKQIGTETLTELKKTREEQKKVNTDNVNNNIETLKLLRDGVALQIQDEKQQATQLLKNSIEYWKAKQKQTEEGSKDYLTLQNNITQAEKKLLQERADMYLEASQDNPKPVDVGSELSNLQAPAQETEGTDEAAKKKEETQAMLQELQTQLQGFNEIMTSSTTVALESIVAASQTYGASIASVLEKAKNGVEVTNEEIATATTAAIAMAGSVTSNILANAIQQQDTSSKEGFEKAKKLQIAQTTIQMLTGVATALSGAFTTKTGPWDLILAAIQAATITASGLATIAQIKKQKYNSTSAGTVSTTSAATDASSSLSVSDYAGIENTNDLTQQLGNTKVYVTETDITETQNKVKTIENNNTY